YRVQQRRRFIPTCAHDKHLQGKTVMPGVVMFLCDNVFGMVTQLSLGPWTGNDNRWGDTAQFTGYAFRTDWLVLALAFRTIGTGSVHNCVVSAGAACHVDFVNARMRGQISANV